MILPKISNSVSHPQSVWFEIHWLPLFDKQQAKYNRLMQETLKLKEALELASEYVDANGQDSTFFEEALSNFKKFEESV